MTSPHPAGRGASATDLVGRGSELAALFALVDEVVAAADPDRTAALVVVGEAGIGKTALLTATSRYAGQVGVRILRADGCRDEADVPFAALSQLLAPMTGLIDALPEHLRRAVATVLGLEHSEHPVDPTSLCLGVLRVLTGAARRAPILVVVDDADRLDRDSMRSLLFVARRVRGADRIGILLAGRGDERPLPADSSLPSVRIPALDDAAAATLLDAQPAVARGRARREILEASDGNPLALEELARMSQGRPWSTSPRVEELFAARLRDLPPATRRLLLHAAAAPGEAVEVIRRAAGRSDDLGDWSPAERSGVVALGSGGVAFRHPLVRSAAYTMATAEERRRAHLALAAAGTEPAHVAWHRAHACVGPDDGVAAALEQVAEQAERRGASSAAARAWERAAECTPGPVDRLRRYRRAVYAVNATGDTDWALVLYDTVREVSDEPAIRIEVASLLCACLTLRGRQRKAFRVLRDAAGPALAAGGPTTALYAMMLMSVAEFSGDPEARELLKEVRTHRAFHPPTGIPSRVGTHSDPDGAAGSDLVASVDLMAASVRWRYDPATSAGVLEALLPCGRIERVTEQDLLVLGGIAGQADDIRRSIELLGRAHASGVVVGSAAYTAGWLAAQLVEHGAWAEADELIDRWTALSDALRLPFVAAEIAAPRATLLALRGRPEAAAAEIERARHLVDLDENLAVDIRLRWASHVAASVSGNRDRSFRVLRGAFTAHGEPRHPLLSAPTVALLAGAAHSGAQRDEARAVVDRVRTGAGDQPSRHLRRLLHHADALLGPEREAEHHFRLALADPTGDDWPLERATARRHYGEWLRRRRRPLEAREMLTTAKDALDALGAVAPAEQVRAELRAAGAADVRADHTDSADDPLAVLSPQQREIVRLAAQGLRNREIGERLFLSPRTVGSHLHHAYPKLGISGRHQLAAVLREG